VPLALISSIYEQFYHDARSRVPSELVPEEDVVSAEGEEAGEDGPYAEKAAGQAEYGDQEVGEANRGVGTHYTPANLVHDALRRTLTPACLALKPKILDPACGSGIFLVEAFRRIVRFEAQGRRRKLLPSELRNILRHRITGVEVNAEAARVIVFSLYLALLDQQEPPDIAAGGPLPYLMHTGVRDEEHYGILVVADAFALTDDERQELTQRVTTKKVYKGRADDVILLDTAGNLDLPLGGFDVVIGNPPWQEAPSKSSVPRLWAASFKLPAGEGSYSQLFIHRALMLRGGGTLGLLVSMKVFWNDRATSRAFRRHLLARAALKQVVNMAHVRRVFFADAVAPFAFLLAENRPPSPDEHVVLWNARRARAVERLRSMAAVPLDRRVVAQRDLTDGDHLWKVYWWGGHHDDALVSRLGLERTLSEVVKGVEPQPRYGWQRGGSAPSGKVAVLRELSNKAVQPFGPLRNGWFLPPPTGTKRDPDQRIYGGQRLVIKRGVREPTGPVARLESKEFTFRHSFYCIPLPHLSEDVAKLALGVLWSSLGRYMLFMTAGSWGGWHDQVTARDLLGLPVRLKASWGMPKAEHDDAAARVVQAVDALRGAELPAHRGPLQPDAPSPYAPDGPEHDALCRLARIAAAYWRAFRDLGLRERKGGDLPRSWLRFANRQKGAQFLGSKRASHPINAMLNYAYVVEAGRLARALTAVGFALPIGFLHSDKHGRNSLVWDAIEPLRPLIDARVFKFIAQREFVRSDFPQAGRNAHRLDRAIIAELLRVSLLPWERHEDAARWMEKTIAGAVKQRLRD
jgi:hypothetical protein